MDTYLNLNLQTARTYAWRQLDGTTVFVECSMNVCDGHKLWRKDFTVRFQFHSVIGPREFRSMADRIDQLVESFKPARLLAPVEF